MEVWKDVVSCDGEYLGRYQVSSEGRVRAHPEAKVRGMKPGRIIFQSEDNKGYKQCGLYLGGKCRTVKVHRLVAEAFLGPRPKGATVNHIDGKKSNNRAENLEFTSILENTRHAHRTIDTRSGVEIEGQRMSLAEAVDRYGIVGVSPKRVRARISRHGWPLMLALTTPAGRTGRPTDAERMARGSH